MPEVKTSRQVKRWLIRTGGVSWAWRKYYPVSLSQLRFDALVRVLEETNKKRFPGLRISYLKEEITGEFKILAIGPGPKNAPIVWKVLENNPGLCIPGTDLQEHVVRMPPILIIGPV